jgi:hypothetical protein
MLALTSMTLVISSVSGCLPETKPGFNSPAPSKRLDAIVEASTLEDDESLVKLVEKLRSHDPAERMFAIRSLEVRTDETLEFDHAAPAWERVEAVDRWIEYLNDRGIETSAIMDDGENDQNDPMEKDTETELSQQNSND